MERRKLKLTPTIVSISAIVMIVVIAGLLVISPIASVNAQVAARQSVRNNQTLVLTPSVIGSLQDKSLTIRPPVGCIVNPSDPSCLKCPPNCLLLNSGVVVRGSNGNATISQKALVNNAGNLHGIILHDLQVIKAQSKGNLTKFANSTLQILVSQKQLSANESSTIQTILRLANSSDIRTAAPQISKLHQDLVNRNASPLAIVIAAVADDSIHRDLITPSAAQTTSSGGGSLGESLQASVSFGDIAGTIVGGAIGGLGGAIVGGILGSL